MTEYTNEHSGKYPQKIPSPKQWGLMISPDHSIHQNTLIKIKGA